MVKKVRLPIRLYMLLGSNPSQRFWRFLILCSLILFTIAGVVICGFFTDGIHIEVNKVLTK